MKKIIVGTLIGCALFTSGAFAAEDIKPMLISAPIEGISESSVKNLIKSHELIIRNNILKPDYKYNNTHYFTSKITGDNIIIPDDIQEKANRIYFLVEEGQNRIFYAEDTMMKGSTEIEEVKEEYNYKIVDFKAGQKEYIFNNKDLVKDFGNDEYKNVTITLIAEFHDEEKIPLSNQMYVSISNKQNVLEQVLNESNKGKEAYYGYYNTNELEIYLEEISDTMKRSEYKKMLLKADKKINLAQTQNESNLKNILKSIKSDTDFAKYTDEYKTYSETRNLLRNLESAIKNQIQNIRSFDAIDVILK